MSLVDAKAEADPLARYHWKSRVLVVLAADAENEAVAEQRRHIESLQSGAAERDLVVLQPLPDSSEAKSLRLRFGIKTADPFTVVLVGKDGGAKLRSNSPIGARELADIIDAMPMRREEMRQGIRPN